MIWRLCIVNQCLGAGHAEGNSDNPPKGSSGALIAAVVLRIGLNLVSAKLSMPTANEGVFASAPPA